MVQTIKENFRIMNKFVKNLKENGIEKILFFGSRLRGDFYPESDFDILVVSNKFQKMSKLLLYNNID